MPNRVRGWNNHVDIRQLDYFPICFQLPKSMSFRLSKMKFTLYLLLGATTSTTTNAGDASNCLFLCSDKNEPVCGSNGGTYTNECLLTLADCESPEQITKVHDGVCITATTPLPPKEPPACPDVCPANYDPVCASDGLTYSNGCVLGIASCQSGGAITQVSDGPCLKTHPGASDCSEACNKVYRPVCGSNNVTYGNSCLIDFAICNDASISMAYEGACKGRESEDYEKNQPSTDSRENTECPYVCILVVDPVCGSNRVTYSNSCFLAIANCKDPTITQVHEGDCRTGGRYEADNTPDQETSIAPENSSCPDVCLAVYIPVCGSDGITYGNECNLNVTSCNNSERNLTKVSDGPCPPLECKTAF